MTVKAAAFSILLLGTLPSLANPAQTVVTFHQAPDQVKAKIVPMMIRTGYALSKDTPYQLAFDIMIPNPGEGSFWGGKYHDQPYGRLIYTIAPHGSETEVIVTTALVFNPGTGMEAVIPKTNDNAASLQAALERLDSQP